MEQEGSDDPLLSKYDEHATGGSSGGSMHWLSAAVVIFSFAMPSGVLAAGFGIGAGGYVLGSFITVVLIGAALEGSQMLLAVALQHPGCHTFGELGGAVLGEKGRRIGECIQYGNFLLFQPIGILLCASTLRGCTGDALGDCQETYVFAVAGVCLLATQARTLENATPVAFVSSLCVLVVAAIQLNVAADGPVVPGPRHAFGNGHPDTATGVVIAMLGTTVAAWSFVPSFLTVELVAAMRRPAELSKALRLSAAASFAVLAGVGCFTVYQWGVRATPGSLVTHSTTVAHSTVTHSGSLTRESLTLEPLLFVAPWWFISIVYMTRTNETMRSLPRDSGISPTQSPSHRSGARAHPPGSLSGRTDCCCWRTWRRICSTLSAWAASASVG
jgi:hypothetical protein